MFWWMLSHTKYLEILVNTKINYLLLAFFILTNCTPMTPRSTITDYIFFPGRDMFANDDLTARKFDSYRINDVVFVPYLIHVDHTSRKLELVAYSNRNHSDAKVVAIKLDDRYIRIDQAFHFEVHRKHPCSWARVVVFQKIDDDEVMSYVANQAIMIEAEVMVGTIRKTLWFKLEQRIRNY